MHIYSTWFGKRMKLAVWSNTCEFEMVCEVFLSTHKYRKRKRKIKKHDDYKQNNQKKKRKKHITHTYQLKKRNRE